MEKNSQLDDVAQDSKLELLGPYVFARVQEKPRGAGTSDLAADGNEPRHVAACDLLVAPQVAKNSRRFLIDGKIESLLQGPEASDHLFNIRMLAILLEYLQDFCLGREIQHLSIQSIEEHPIWLTDFFKLADFQVCQCLKPDEAEQGQRMCLNLSKHHKTESSKALDVTPQVNHEESKQDVEVKRQNPLTATSPKATNGATKEAPLQDQATAWLSQNKEILGPGKNPGAAKIEAGSSSVSELKSIKEGSIKDGKVSPKHDALAGSKRKRLETNLRPEDDESLERNRRNHINPWTHDGAGEALPTKQYLKEKEERLKQDIQRLQQSSSSDADVRDASTPSNSKMKKSNDEQIEKTHHLTDALLAQCSKSTKDRPASNIKKEDLGPSSSMPVADWRDHQTVGKSLTCYYWATQGSCKWSESQCLHAHRDTGEIARPPGSFKFSKRIKHGSDYNDNSNGVSIRGGADWTTRGDGAAPMPTKPRAHADRAEEGISKTYDSYRPENGGHR